jgi:hypothetical protein
MNSLTFVVIGPLRCGKTVTLSTGKTTGEAELIGRHRRRTGITSPLELDVELRTRCVLPAGHVGTPCIDRDGNTLLGFSGPVTCAGCGCHGECNCIRWFHPYGYPGGGYNFSLADLHSAAAEVGLSIEGQPEGVLLAFDPSRNLIARADAPDYPWHKRGSAAADLFSRLLDAWPPFREVASRFETWGISTGAYVPDRCPPTGCPKPWNAEEWTTCENCRRAQILCVAPRGEVKTADARLRWVYRVIDEVRP